MPTRAPEQALLSARSPRPCLQPPDPSPGPSSADPRRDGNEHDYSNLIGSAGESATYRAFSRSKRNGRPGPTRGLASLGLALEEEPGSIGPAKCLLAASTLSEIRLVQQPFTGARKESAAGTRRPDFEPRTAAAYGEADFPILEAEVPPVSRPYRWLRAERGRRATPTQEKAGEDEA